MVLKTAVRDVDSNSNDGDNAYKEEIETGKEDSEKVLEHGEDAECSIEHYLEQERDEKLKKFEVAHKTQWSAANQRTGLGAGPAKVSLEPAWSNACDSEQRVAKMDELSAKAMCASARLDQLQKLVDVISGVVDDAALQRDIREQLNVTAQSAREINRKIDLTPWSARIWNGRKISQKYGYPRWSRSKEIKKKKMKKKFLP